ncbi:MAG TPA: Holliday junction branch migration protein RuvA [Bacteroidales bacterium]|jgi:Holliday junction DNA helicase RuvA|nr:Holliday junction branch migration protein RuvA [Bacteroidales bacterium]MDI9553761.1 Holliday junction branch migration protein RuvA [Bacteroidota bacterium]MBP7039242.1 Holliday junction branch migration protein RuvA [Bacteroidales bacterium]MZP64803.1 Holliday junction branch migration protein RuvA [Bacteroidales bacterium]NLK53718.1 Holliday junction branch migration protein RuvA [Bacteroidales bacterium]
MIDYITGRIAELTPAYIIIDNGGIGWFANISLTTYSRLEGKTECKLLVHEVIREDSHQLYGFSDREEREMFRLLITVSGVGAATARMMLSSLTHHELEKAILGADVNILKGVKGIGLKTAQRIIVDLKDKVGKPTGTGEIFVFTDNTKREEALSALVMLGFGKSAVLKVLDRIIRDEKDLTVEELIKRALKSL